MFDFFNEFFSSDLVKNHTVAMIAVMILCAVVGAVIMYFILSKLYYKKLQNDYDDLKKAHEKLKKEKDSLEKKYKDLEERHKSLRETNDKLKYHDTMYVSQHEKTDDGLSGFIDPSRS